MPEVSCIGVVLFLFLVFLILVVILPSIARSRTRGSRQAVIRQIEGKALRKLREGRLGGSDS